MSNYNDLYNAAQYIISCISDSQGNRSPYVLWTGGYVSDGDGPPAWGVNEPPPPASEVQRRGAFCAWVPNGMHRHMGLTIPNPYNAPEYDGGIVSYWEAYYDASEYFRLGTDYPDGTFVMSPYNSEAAGDQGHIAMVWHYQGQMYAIEWIFTGATWDNTLEYSNTYGNFQIAIRPEVWVPLAGGSWESSTGGGAKPAENKEYPGDLANPDVVARWMARVAHEDYGLPPVLPVMTSYCELTDAWTGPGDVRTVNGYQNRYDHTSLGYFQQQDNWGTYEQRTNADWALRKFCEEAAKLKDYEWTADQADPDTLGRWCAAVQRPREDLEYLYAYKGYEPAMKLIKGWDRGGDVPVPPGPPEPPADKEYPYGWFALDDQGKLTAVDVPKGTWAAFEKYEDGKLYLVGHSDPAWRKAKTKVHEVEYYEEDGEAVVKESDGQRYRYSKAEFQERYEVEEK